MHLQSTHGYKRDISQKWTPLNIGQSGNLPLNSYILEVFFLLIMAIMAIANKYERK